MADEFNNINTPDTPAEDAPTKGRDAISSHGVRTRDADWATWQEVVSAYPSAADAFSDLMTFAKMRVAGDKVGVPANADMIMQHCREIATLYSEAANMMDAKTKVAAEELIKKDQQYQQQLQAARSAEAKARADAQMAKESEAAARKTADEAEKAVKAARKERELALADLESVRDSLASANQILAHKTADADSARAEAKSLREDTDRARAEIASLREQLASAKATLAEEQMARRMDGVTAKAMADQLAFKDELIHELREHVQSLQRERASFRETQVMSVVQTPDLSSQDTPV